jgi:hypothetical protein
MTTSTKRKHDCGLLTPADVARLRGVGIDRVLSWIHSGELRACNDAATLGGRPRWKIEPADLERFVRRRYSSKPPEKMRRRRRKMPEGTIRFFQS